MAECGLTVVRGLETKVNMVKRLAELIAPVQKTMYNEIFDVR